MLIILFSLLVAVIGLVIFVVSKQNPDLKQIGYALMLAGFIATLILIGPKTVSWWN